MAGAFQLLRSSDLVWSKVVHDYLIGERRPLTDLMAWNADGTRLPYKMHTEYLRKLYLRNELASGRFEVDGKPIALTDIRAPIFAVGAEWDHVVPWHSAFRLQLLTDTEVTFLLTKGGHNAGIVSPPGNEDRTFRIRTKAPDGPYADPETWFAETAPAAGSWWPAWFQWLEARSGAPTESPAIGATERGLVPLAAAPGAYIHRN
jgi:polyhydroxyalkanoate synthase